MSFISKKLTASETVGGYLRELFAADILTIPEIAQALHVQEKHVRALFDNRFSELPGSFYVKHLIRQCASLLDGNADYAEKLFLRIPGTEQKSENAERVFDRKKVRSTSLIVWARVLTGTAFVAVFALLLVSFGGNIRNALTPPTIDLLSPSGDLVTSNRELVVEGKTEPEVTLRVNGEQVITDSNGVFSVPLYLDDGLNIIEVRAAKRYSKDQIVYRKILVEQKSVSFGNTR